MHPPPGPSRIAVLAVAALLAVSSCGVPGASASPSAGTTTPTSSVSSVSSGPAVTFPTGPAVTVPGLTTEAAPESPSSPAVETSATETTPSPVEPTAETTTEPPQEAPPAPDPSTPTSSTAPTPSPPTTTPPSTGPAQASASERPRDAGAVVVIDAGHNGANGANPSVINALVDAGFGQTKPCNTTGTSTDDGYTESTFNFGVAQYLVPMLEAEGITVITTRDSNDGVGPCVDRRAAIGNDAQADAVVSIHGDGDDASAAGFYVMTAEQNPAGAAVAAESRELAVAVRDGLIEEGLSPHNRLGSDGLWRRGDLAGLNLSRRPTVMIEAGNMRNPADAALMTSAEGQRQVARGLADGILAYLAAAG